MPSQGEVSWYENYFGNEELARLSYVRLAAARPPPPFPHQPLSLDQGLMRASALFAGSVVLMRLYGDAMAV